MNQEEDTPPVLPVHNVSLATRKRREARKRTQRKTDSNQEQEESAPRPPDGRKMDAAVYLCDKELRPFNNATQEAKKMELVSHTDWEQAVFGLLTV